MYVFLDTGRSHSKQNRFRNRCDYPSPPLRSKNRIPTIHPRRTVLRSTLPFHVWLLWTTWTKEPQRELISFLLGSVTVVSSVFGSKLTGKYGRWNAGRHERDSLDCPRSPRPFAGMVHGEESATELSGQPMHEAVVGCGPNPVMAE